MYPTAWGATIAVKFTRSPSGSAKAGRCDRPCGDDSVKLTRTLIFVIVMTTLVCFVGVCRELAELADLTDTTLTPAGPYWLWFTVRIVFSSNVTVFDTATPFINIVS